jgi:hypothetical protein
MGDGPAGTSHPNFGLELELPVIGMAVPLYPSLRTDRSLRHHTGCQAHSADIFGFGVQVLRSRLAYPSKNQIPSALI